MVEKNEERVLLLLCNVFFNKEKIGTFLSTMALSISDSAPKWYKIKGKLKKKIDAGINNECKYYPICNEVSTKILKYCRCPDYPDLKFEIWGFSCVDCVNLSSYGKNKSWCEEQMEIEDQFNDGAQISATIETVSVKMSEIGANTACKKKKPIIFTIYDGYDLMILDENVNEALQLINGPNDFVGDKIILRQYYEDGSSEILYTKSLPRACDCEPNFHSQEPIEKSKYKIVFNNTDYNISVKKLIKAIDLVDKIREYSMNFVVKLFRLNKYKKYFEIDVG